MEIGTFALLLHLGSSNVSGFYDLLAETNTYD
jgi:hypothetical protein